MSKYNIKQFGAYSDGTNAATTTTAIATALTTIGSVNPETLVFPAGTYALSGSVDWSTYTNITFKMEPGAIISHGSYTIHMANAPEAGVYQIFSGTGAKTFDRSLGVYPEWFGTTEYGAMISQAILAIKATGGEITFTRNMGATTAVNCTSTTGPILFKGRGSPAGAGGAGEFPKLTFTLSGGNAFDCTGAQAVTFENWALATDASSYPDIGILLARGADGATGAAGHKFKFFKIDYSAKFTTAALYNYASEELDFISCQFVNRVAGSRVVILTASNINTKTSAFTTIYSGTSSMSTVNFYGGRYIQLGGAATSDIFYLESAVDIHWHGGFWGNASGRAYIVANTNVGAVSHISIDSIRGEPGATSAYGLLFTSAVLTSSSNWAIRNSRWDCSTRNVYADVNSTLIKFTWQNVSEQTSTGLQFVGSVSDSFFDKFSSLTISGTSTNNLIIGVNSGITIGTRLRDMIFDLDNGEWLPFLAFGDLADSATPSVANKSIWRTTGTTTITNLTGGREGEIKHILAETGLTITDGTNIFLNGSVNWTMVATDSLTLICRQSKWYELSRSDNT